MKPEPVLLRGVTDSTELARRVLHTRLREVRRLAGGLERRDQRGLHDFRIACKRFRYALERFSELEPSLERIRQMFARRGRLNALRCRPLAQWRQLLARLGFRTRTVPMRGGAPFTNVLLAAELP